MSKPNFLPLREIRPSSWIENFLKTQASGLTGHPKIHGYPFVRNSGAASMLQYFSCPNQVIATHTRNHNRFMRGFNWMSYRPYQEVQCCTGNVHHAMMFKFTPHLSNPKTLPELLGQEVEWIEMVPYGSTLLRMTFFPQATI